MCAGAQYPGGGDPGAARERLAQRARRRRARARRRARRAARRAARRQYTAPCYTIFYINNN